MFWLIENTAKNEGIWSHINLKWLQINNIQYASAWIAQEFNAPNVGTLEVFRKRWKLHLKYSSDKRVPTLWIATLMRSNDFWYFRWCMIWKWFFVQLFLCCSQLLSNCFCSIRLDLFFYVLSQRFLQPLTWFNVFEYLNIWTFSKRVLKKRTTIQQLHRRKQWKLLIISFKSEKRLAVLKSEYLIIGCVFNVFFVCVEKQQEH